MNLVGPGIRKARLTAKLTQGELAARLNLRGMRIDRTGVAKIELKLRQVSDVELKTIADALGTSAVELLQAIDESPV